jgi:H+-transporting ATPase
LSFCSSVRQSYSVNPPSSRCTDTPDIVLNKITWLDNIGRHTRSSKNEKLENFLTDLQRLTIVHESDGNGSSFYRFADGTRSRDEAEEGEQGKKGKDGKNGNGNGNGKDGKDDKGKDKGKETKSSMSRRSSTDKLGEGKQVSFSQDRAGGKGDDKEGQSDPAEGDKQMMDQQGQGAEAEEDRRALRRDEGAGAARAGRQGPGDGKKAEVSTKNPHELGAVSQVPQKSVEGTTDPAKDAGAGL